MSDDKPTVDRRSVLKGVGTGAAVSSLGGVASAGRVQRDWDITPTRRAELKAPYEDLETARGVLEDTVGPLVSRLAADGVLDSPELSDVEMSRLVSSQPVSEPASAVSVTAAWNDEAETAEVLVETGVPLDDGVVTLSANPERGEGYAIVASEDGIEQTLQTDGLTVQSTDDGYLVCGDVCDDCCGAFDCTAEQTVKYLVNGTVYSTSCGCLSGAGIPIPGQCCEGSCAGWFPCSC